MNRRTPIKRRLASNGGQKKDAHRSSTWSSLERKRDARTDHFFEDFFRVFIDKDVMRSGLTHSSSSSSSVSSNDGKDRISRLFECGLARGDKPSELKEREGMIKQLVGGDVCPGCCSNNRPPPPPSRAITGEEPEGRGRFLYTAVTRLLSDEEEEEEDERLRRMS